MDDSSLDAYLLTIVSLVKRLNPDEDKDKPKFSIMFAQTDYVKQRFEVLLKRNDCMPKRIRYAVWVIMLLIFVMSYFVIIQPYYSAPNVLSGVDMLITQDNSYIVTINDEYFLIIEDNYVYKLTASDLDRPPCNSLIIIGE